MRAYGLTEIARALGVDPVLVAKWRERGKLPPADAELSVGPVWLADTMKPLLESGGPGHKPRGRRPRTYVQARSRRWSSLVGFRLSMPLISSASTRQWSVATTGASGSLA